MKDALKYLFLIIFVSFPFFIFSQSVALVLSGGGAKAYSHIGVLRALEENNIPIDYIVGNSMGALIGGLYASGYSPDEIEIMLTHNDFIDFTKENNSKDVCFYQEDEATASIINLTFKVEKGLEIQFPLNVYDFREIDYQLMEFFAGASMASKFDFDSLMIPFRCVAADIDSSRMVVFKDGSLTKAVRASFTFPFFVRPIDIDGTLFFDGGMYDNFPVGVALEEFNPDIILGSKAVNNYESPNPDNAISLIQSMLMTKADYEIDSVLGVVIESNTGFGSIFQFSNAESYIDSGYVAAIEMIGAIKARMVNNDIAKLPSANRKDFISSKPELSFTDIKIEGLNNRQQKYFEKLIGDYKRFKGPKDFHKLYNCIISNENITNIYPEIEYDSILKSCTLNLRMKKSEPFNLDIGGYISSSGVNEAYLNLDYNYFGSSAKNISVGAYFGTFYNSLSTMAKIEFPNRIPLTLKLNFLMSRKNYFSNARYFYEDKFPAYIITDENYLDFSIGIPVGYNGVACVGLSNINAYYQYYQDNYFTRTDTADVSNFYYLTPWFEFQLNTLNHRLYPTRGHNFFAGFGYYSGNEKYTQGSGKAPATEVVSYLNYYSMVLRYVNYFRLSEKVSLGLTGEIGVSSKPLLDSYVSSLLLSTPFEPLPVMKTLFLENYRSNNYGSIGAVFNYNFLKKFNFRLDGYYYLPYEKILKDTKDNSPYLSPTFSYNYLVGSARVVYYPPFGVISASVVYIEKPGNKFGFLLNLGYLIFNKSKLNR